MLIGLEPRDKTFQGLHVIMEEKGEFSQYRNDIRERRSYHHNLIGVRNSGGKERTPPSTSFSLCETLHRKAVKRPINFRRIDRDEN